MEASKKGLLRVPGTASELNLWVRSSIRGLVKRKRSSEVSSLRTGEPLFSRKRHCLRLNGPSGAYRFSKERFEAEYFIIRPVVSVTSPSRDSHPNEAHHSP